MLATNVYVAVQQIRRHLEDSCFGGFGLHALQLGAAFSSCESRESRDWRADLGEQSAERVLVFNVEFLSPVALKHALDICLDKRRRAAPRPQEPDRSEARIGLPVETAYRQTAVGRVPHHFTLDIIGTDAAMTRATVIGSRTRAMVLPWRNQEGLPVNADSELFR